MGILNAECPWFASKLFHLGYILQLARDLKTQKCDVTHIQNFSQFVPIIRAFNSHAKIVLYMHCEWLAQLGRISPEKGVHVLLDAFKKVLIYFPQAEIQIIGPEIVVAKEMIDSSLDRSAT